MSSKKPGVPATERPQFETWKAILFGCLYWRSAESYKERIIRDGCDIGPWANDIIEAGCFTQTRRLLCIETVKISGDELGYKHLTTREEIYQRANDLGLVLVPQDLALYLPTQYREQPVGERLIVASRPIAMGKRKTGLFKLSMTDVGQELCGVTGERISICEGEDMWLFTTPKALRALGMRGH